MRRSRTRPTTRRGVARFLIVAMILGVACSARPALSQESAASAAAVRPSSEPSKDFVLQNEFVRIVVTDGAVATFCCDSTGRAQYGPNLVAAEGIRSPNSPLQVAINGRDVEIQLSTAAAADVLWSVPFHCAGYYDADAHRLYESPQSLDSQPHREVFRKFVAGTGHARYIEELKRIDIRISSSYPQGTVVTPLWLGPYHESLWVCDREIGTELRINWPNAEHLACAVKNESLTFSAPLQGKLRVHIQPGDSERVPGSRFEPLSLQVFPDQTLTQSLTDKHMSLNRLLQEFLQHGLYFYPGVITGGDWLHGAMSVHHLDDNRSPYVQSIRRSFLEAANVGYDRCGHFGSMYCWGHSPNYGDGGFLSPSIDARHLHINWVFICSAARYLLMSRDEALLHARRARWLQVDDAEPIGGAEATCPDPLLIKGDWRIDFLPPTQHSLGQSFVAHKTWRCVKLKLSNTGKAAATVRATVKRDGPAGKELTSCTITLAPLAEPAIVPVTLDAPAEPGTYYVQIVDTESGRKWDGSVCWWTDPATTLADGDAFNGPFHGDFWQLLCLLFEYNYQHFGPQTEGVAAYTQAAGCGPNRSGRIGDPIVCVSYWEQFGGGKDMWSSLWYPSVCTAMAELARWQGLDAEAERYTSLRAAADTAFRATFGRETIENSRAVYRYVAAVDWDGKPHDYGHAHYNLESIARGIASESESQRILDWLDHGQFSPDGGTTWQDDIYSLWQIAPPFLTVNNRDWQGLGGMPGGFPYGSVLGAGGTRLLTAAVDLEARARTQGIDKAWQRALQILDRYARPDRLTGGRTFNDPGGRGRWHFGPPDLERADIEGFREIFPDNGAVATALPCTLLGLAPTARGLSLTPRVPSALDGYEVSGLGYAQTVWKIRVHAHREPNAGTKIVVTLTPLTTPPRPWSVEQGTRSLQPAADPAAIEIELSTGESLSLVVDDALP